MYMYDVVGRLIALLAVDTCESDNREACCKTSILLDINQLHTLNGVIHKTVRLSTMI